MKIKRILSVFVVVLMCLSMFSLQVFAENNLVPYDGGGAASAAPETPGATNPGGANGQLNTDLFAEVHIVKDENATAAANQIANVASIIITFIISVMPILLSLQLVLDMACILLKPLAVAVSKFPCCQLNSDEAIAVTGVGYAGKGGNAGGAPPTDLQGKNPMVYYVYSRLKVVIFATVMCILIATGLLFNVVLFVANHIVTWIAGLI